MAASNSDAYPWQEAAKPVNRGLFIDIEGLDRAGKTTQVKKLCDELYATGRNVKMIRFPGMQPRGQCLTPSSENLMLNCFCFFQTVRPPLGK